MKAIMLMFDTLNLHMLPPYGCDWVQAPNFQRLAEKSVVFDRCYAGSLPCMPARRELHTGRYNFLHASWGPIEPFDDSMPEMLKDHGVYTHLVSDHFHYWSDGGSTYHMRYSSWENFRGQAGDHWKGEVAEPEIPENLNGSFKEWARHDFVNRKYMTKESEHPLVKTIEAGKEFITTNHKEDRWFLQIECFSPHEPFITYEDYTKLYPHDYEGPLFDWPPYDPVQEPYTEQHVNHARMLYAAYVTMCDRYLGQVLDMMDELNMWKDTMLIVNTDHGLLFGEHGWWAKCRSPFYNEVAHIPLFIWDPRAGIQGERRNSLVQTIDIAPTLLEFFDVNIPERMMGKALRDTIESDKPLRDAALFGMFGGQVSCTDGKFVYMRSSVNPNNMPLYEYTLMPTGHGHDRAFIEVERLQTAELSEPFNFTKGCRLLKMEASHPRPRQLHFPTTLYDIEADPYQQHPLQNLEVEARMISHMKRLMELGDAPKEQFIRLGIDLR